MMSSGATAFVRKSGQLGARMAHRGSPRPVLPDSRPIFHPPDTACPFFGAPSA